MERLVEVFRNVPLMPDVELVFEKLKRLGFKTALISSGVPDFVVQDLASKLRADYAFGMRLETKNGVENGEVSGEVAEKNGKLSALKRIMETEGLKAENCVIVADDRNNLPMMLPHALKIGFNPDFLVSFKADHVVSGVLSGILPLIGAEKRVNRAAPSRNEVFREAIHACGVTVPFLSSFLGLFPVVTLVSAVTLLYSFSMLAFLHGRNIPVFSMIIRRAATPGETHSFAFAPVYFALGILAAMILFLSLCAAPLSPYSPWETAAPPFSENGDACGYLSIRVRP